MKRKRSQGLSAFGVVRCTKAEEQKGSEKVPVPAGREERMKVRLCAK